MLFALLACAEPALDTHVEQVPVYSSMTTTCDAQPWNGSTIIAAVECSDTGLQYRCRAVGYTVVDDYETGELLLEPECADMTSAVLLTVL